MEGLEMMQTHIITAVLSAAIAAASAWSYQANRYDARIASIEKTHAEAVLTAGEAARASERAIATKYQGALNAATARQNDLRRHADAARAESHGLRDTLYSFRASLPSATRTTVIARADTAAELLGACAAEYQDVAAAADGHASDARTLIEAWPVSEVR